MKAQTGIEFVLSIALFLIVVTYCVSIIVGLIPVFWSQSGTEKANALAFQFSQDVLFSKNFSNDIYLINKTQINKIGNKINETQIRDVLGFKNETTFAINITDLNGNEKASVFMSKFKGQTRKTIIDRIALMDKDLVRVRIFIG